MSRTYQIFVYPLQGKVLFPYHEHQVTITSNKFDAKNHNYLIGFVTNVDSQLTNVDVIGGVSKYGTLMRIEKVDRYESAPDAKSKINRLTVCGLIFVRFRVIQLVPEDVGFKARVQILNDQIPSNQKILVQKAQLRRFKIQLITFYQYTCSPGEAELMKLKILSQHRVSKLIFMSMCDLSLSVGTALILLSLNTTLDRISTMFQCVASITGSKQRVPDSPVTQLNHNEQQNLESHRVVNTLMDRVDSLQDTGTNLSQQEASTRSRIYQDRINHHPQISRNGRHLMPKF